VAIEILFAEPGQQTECTWNRTGWAPMGLPLSTM